MRSIRYWTIKQHSDKRRRRRNLLLALAGLNNSHREALVLPFKVFRCVIGYTPVMNETLPYRIL